MEWDEKWIIVNLLAMSDFRLELKWGCTKGGDKKVEFQDIMKCELRKNYENVWLDKKRKFNLIIDDLIAFLMPI